MIKYNLRYRGPFEYDKFVLNILQFSNEVRYLSRDLKNGEGELLCQDGSKIKELFDKLTNEGGLMDRLHRLRIKTIERGTATND